MLLTPSADTYCAWGDEIEAYGSDAGNEVLKHSIRLEVYEHTPDPDAHRRLQRVLNEAAIPWSKEMRVWMQDVQVYFTVYSYAYTERI